MCEKRDQFTMNTKNGMLQAIQAKNYSNYFESNMGQIIEYWKSHTKGREIK